MRLLRRGHIAAVLVAGASTLVATSVAASSAPLPSDPASVTYAPAPAAVKSWFLYNRPARYDAVVREVEVPTRSGDVLSCDRYRPGHGDEPDAGKHPGLVLDFLPYGFRQAGATVNRATYYAQHGYDVVVCDAPGTGKSTGEFKAVLQPREARDNYDLIEWLAARPTSNGKIAQTGASYGGMVSYRVAALRPPHLVTIVPEIAPTNLYSDWVYPGGIPSSLIMSLWSGTPATGSEAHASMLASFQAHPLYDSFWRQVDAGPKLSSIRVPMLYVGGHFDIFNGGFNTLRERPRKTWVVYGPWQHMLPTVAPGTDPSGNHTQEDPTALSEAAVLRWMDHWTLGLKKAGLPPSRVTSFRSSSNVQSGTWHGRWHSYADWPSARGKHTRMYPTADGRLRSTVPTRSVLTYDVDPQDGPSAAPFGSLPWDPTVDQTKADETRTTFTSRPFTRSTAVVGPVTLHLRARMRMKDTNFVSKLEVITEDGKTLPITTGHLRAQLRNSLSKQIPVPSGKAVNYTVELGDTDWKFQAGERLRVTISGGDNPFVDASAPEGSVDVILGSGTSIHYTVR